MTTILKTVVPASIGPVERKLGYVYAHDIELDGDEDVAVGQRVEIVDEGGHMLAAGDARSVTDAAVGNPRPP